MYRLMSESDQYNDQYVEYKPDFTDLCWSGHTE